MPIRRSLTDKPKRESQHRTAKGRHPLLKLGSRHLNVWDILCNAGLDGYTAAQIKARTTFYHPQIMKDLLDARLITQIEKDGNEFTYIADPRGIGIIPHQVRVEVKLLEDEAGYFHAVAYVKGSTQQPKGAVRVIAERGFNFKVPLEDDVLDPVFREGMNVVSGDIIDGKYVTVVTDPSQMIIEQKSS